MKLLTDLLSLLYESQSRCHFVCKTEIVWFVLYSEHCLASVTCGSFHSNQTSKCVLANKGTELNIVFSLKADALIFYFVDIKLCGTAGASLQMLYLQYEFLLSQSSNVNKTTRKATLEEAEIFRKVKTWTAKWYLRFLYVSLFSIKCPVKWTWAHSVTDVVFSTLNSFDIVLSLVHALLTDVTAPQVECKV